ncbi:MAG: DUF559 domain-containing protein [Armatimonadetes bacterium]|nr:DUF559 domain-containing protein [Armatimonadota bacterium]
MYNRTDRKELRRRLRRDSTEGERILWAELQAHRLDGLKFRRQYGVGPYVVDFCFPAAKLVVAIDGPTQRKPGLCRRARSRRDLPLPPPWQGGGDGGGVWRIVVGTSPCPLLGKEGVTEGACGG